MRAAEQTRKEGAGAAGPPGGGGDGGPAGPEGASWVMAATFWRTPLDAGRVKPPRGQVHVLVDRCKGCGFCVEYCPRDVLELSRAFNAKGYHPPDVRRPEACVKCDQCQLVCPEFAIFAVEAAS